MYYDPQTNKFPYTEQTDQHYLHVKMDRGITFDKDYPYIDNSKSFRFKQTMVRILLYLIVFPVARIRLGLKVVGRKNLKKNKELIKQGVLSCCNHVHMWDYIGVMIGALPRKTNILVWDKNVNGENGTLIRMVGGIPVPENNIPAFMKFYKTVENLLVNGGWVHIYGEGSMWEYYRPIRPLKQGVSYFACHVNKPIIPLAYSYRKPSWIRRVIFKQIACFTLNIGEPLFRNDTLEGKEQEHDLTTRLHEAMCELAGYQKGENPYPPIFNNDKRVDYYTSTYGVGYKGSH